MEKFLGYTIAFIIMIGLIIFGPIINFWFGYFGGWILMNFVGQPLTNALNIIFNTTRFSANMIPYFCGGMTVIGGFFKNNSINSNKKN